MGGHPELTRPGRKQGTPNRESPSPKGLTHKNNPQPHTPYPPTRTHTCPRIPSHTCNHAISTHAHHRTQRNNTQTPPTYTQTHPHMYLSIYHIYMYIPQMHSCTLSQTHPIDTHTRMHTPTPTHLDTPTHFTIQPHTPTLSGITLTRTATPTLTCAFPHLQAQEHTCTHTHTGSPLFLLGPWVYRNLLTTCQWKLGSAWRERPPVTD